MASPAQKRRIYTGLVALCGAWVFVLFACGNADCGPPRWLDDFEIGAFGRYWTLANVLLLAVPPCVAVGLARRKLVVRDELDIAADWLKGGRSTADWVWAGAFGALALGLGAMLLARGLGAGEARVITALEAESGTVTPPGNGARVEVHGFAGRKALKVVHFGLPTSFVPLLGVAPPSKKDGTGASTLLEPGSNSAAPAAEAPVPETASVPPAIVVESSDTLADFTVAPNGELVVHGLVMSDPIAARMAGSKIGLAEDRPVIYVRASATPTRDIVAGVLVLLAGGAAVFAQLRKKKLTSDLDREVARNEGAW